MAQTVLGAARTILDGIAGIGTTWLGDIPNPPSGDIFPACAVRDYGESGHRYGTRVRKPTNVTTRFDVILYLTQSAIDVMENMAYAIAAALHPESISITKSSVTRQVTLYRDDGSWQFDFADMHDKNGVRVYKIEFHFRAAYQPFA